MQPLLLYIEVNLLCALILLLIAIKTVKGNEARDTQTWFVGVLCAGIAAFSLDIVWTFVMTDSLDVGFFGSYLINASYYFLATVASYCWFVYSERVQRSRFARTRRGLLISAIPLMISFALIVSSAATGWVLSIDETGAYERGDWYYVQFAIVYGYGAVTAVHAVFNAFKKENFALRSQYLTLTYFAIFPLLFISLQAALPGVPLTCVGMTFSLLWVYLNMQEQNISLDPLTQLNNRTHLAKYVAQKMRHRDAERTLCLFIIDVDCFKQINDTFGHVEGDRALQRVADAMRRLSAKEPAFLSRYGGDEFIIVKDAPGTCDAVAASALLNAELGQLNEEAQAPYEMRVSVGGARYESGIRTLQDFIRAADRELYEAKAKRSQEGRTR